MKVKYLRPKKLAVLEWCKISCNFTKILAVIVITNKRFFVFFFSIANNWRKILCTLLVQKR